MTDSHDGLSYLLKIKLATDFGKVSNVRVISRSGLNNKAETVLLVEKDKSNGDISNVSAMHIRAMDFEPFAFRINDKCTVLLQESA